MLSRRLARSAWLGLVWTASAPNRDNRDKSDEGGCLLARNVKKKLQIVVLNSCWEVCGLLLPFYFFFGVLMNLISSAEISLKDSYGVFLILRHNFTVSCHSC